MWITGPGKLFMEGSPSWTNLLILSALHCKTDESHAPHKFTKMQSGLMTNVISPNSINIWVLKSSVFWTDTPFLCLLCFTRVKYDSEIHLYFIIGPFHFPPQCHTSSWLVERAFQPHPLSFLEYFIIRHHSTLNILLPPRSLVYVVPYAELTDI
jgi:hypothetical protein